MREEIIQILNRNSYAVSDEYGGSNIGVYDDSFEEVASEILSSFKEKLKEAYNDGFGDTLYDFDAETYTD